jgi:hypothetical protein
VTRRAAIVAAALAGAALASGAAAQDAPVRVRGGDHPTYSRIVIDGPRGGPAPRWGVANGELTVLLPGLNRPLAPAVGRLSRVAGVAVIATAEGPALRVSLACPCGARLERLGDGRIVIDVSEGGARPAPPALASGDAMTAAEPSSAEPPAATPAATVEPPAAAIAGLPPAPAPRPASLAARAPGSDASAPAEAARAPAAPPAPEAASAPSPAAAPVEAEPARAEAAPAQAPAPSAAPAQPAAVGAEAPPPVNPGGTPSEATIAAARSQLLQQLTRATEEGFLTLAEPPKEPPKQAASEDEAAAEAPPPPPPADADELAALASQLRSRTAADLAKEGEAGRRPLSDDKPKNCAPPDLFDLASWTDVAPLLDQIGARRNRLVGEFDLPNGEAVAAYARMLVAHGFGVEARAALSAFADEVPAPPMLMDIAYVAEGEAAPDGALKQGLGCPGPHGLWAAAAVALDGGLDPASIDLSAMREPLAVLPPRIRTQLILPIADAALTAGMLTEAEALAGIAARGEPPAPDGDGMLAILLARIDAARGDWARAEAGLQPLLASASPAGVEAAIRMVEFRQARRTAAPSGLAENMEAMAFTLGPSTQGRRLLRAAALARATGEGLGLALSSLKRLAAEDGEAASSAARDMVVDYAPAPGEEAAYAQAVLDHLELIGDGPESDRARIAASGRLAELGLENLAETLLAPALARGSAAARVAAAEAATAAMEPDRALTHLEGMTGERAARARAAAFAANGDYGRAATAAQETGDRALAARYAWLAGNWAAAAAAGDADRRILAAWMAGAGEMPEELKAAAAADPALAAQAEAFSGPDATDGKSLLEQAGEALEASKRRREVVGGLLTDG